MDVSQVQSGKCGSSDFSIERILSDDRREESEVPSWLCCTRYQPPRIPRPVSSNACRPRRSGRHARVPFTAAQAAALEAAYARAPYLAPPALRALAAALQLRDDRIKIWFQNRRARERREKCITITPPHSMLLPSTLPHGALIAPNPWIPNSAPASKATFTEPQDLTTSSVACRNDTSDDDSAADRPETPLDIETVEE